MAEAAVERAEAAVNEVVTELIRDRFENGGKSTASGSNTPCQIGFEDVGVSRAGETHHYTMFHVAGRATHLFIHRDANEACARLTASARPRAVCVVDRAQL